jgi:hypothetical protein
VAAAGSGRIGAAWVVTDPPAKIRPAIPIANIVRNICVSQFSMVDALFIEAVRTTDQLKNKASRSMNGHSPRNKWARPCNVCFWPKRAWFLSKIPCRGVLERRSQVPNTAIRLAFSIALTQASAGNPNLSMKKKFRVRATQEALSSWLVSKFAMRESIAARFRRNRSRAEITAATQHPAPAEEPAQSSPAC